jgi:hypothetical protein
MYARMRGCESTHARMGNLSQCMPECVVGFCKILLALWATWFFFLYVIIFAQYSLPQQALHQYNISCIVVPQWQELHWWHHLKVNVKGQGHIIVKVGCQRNPYFLSSFHQINFKLGVKVEYWLPLSCLVFGADQPWPSWVSVWVVICLPEGQILKSKVPYGNIWCSTSYKRSWWVLSKLKKNTLWRHFVTS